MIRIIICDDNEHTLLQLQEAVWRFFKRNHHHASILANSSAEAFTPDDLARCDIALLDIDLSGNEKNGIDLARSIRASSDAVIIFITNYVEYAIEGYEVQAFRYLLKSELDRHLDEYLTLALLQRNKQQQAMQVRIDGELIDIPIDQIFYLEAKGHTVEIHCRGVGRGFEKRSYHCYGTLSHYEKKLQTFGFLRIQKSYLVNMKHIKKYQCHELTLSNGETLKASEKYYASQKKIYLLWRGAQ